MFTGFRLAATGLAVALVGLSIATGAASAATGNDGTSNTIQYSVAAAPDQAQHRVDVVTPRLMEEEGIYPPFA